MPPSPYLVDGNQAHHAMTPDTNPEMAKEDGKPLMHAIPRISLNLYEHKTAIAISGGILFMSSCVLPVLLYFILRHVAHASLPVVLGVPSAIFGVVTLPSLLRRTWSLAKTNSSTRPIGAGRWSFDYFHYNFLLGFIYITILIVISTSLHPAQPRIACMALTLLLFQVCTQCLLVSLLMMIPSTRSRYPFTCSSMHKGTGPVRPAVYSIVEDVVAVDGGQGTRFREELNQRYMASASIRGTMRRFDLLWGASGFAVAVVLVVLIWTVGSEDVAWTIGWTVPWVWAAICALITISWTKAALRHESFSTGATDDLERSTSTV